MLGLWIDGVPFNSDRSQSLECVTLSICGLKDWRMPLVCFPQSFKRKQETFEAIFEVLLWSFRCLILDSLLAIATMGVHGSLVMLTGRSYAERAMASVLQPYLQN